MQTTFSGMIDVMKRDRFLMRCIVLACIMSMFLLGSALGASPGPAPIRVLLPLDNSLFPADMAPPLVRWTDDSGALSWRIKVTSSLGELSTTVDRRPSWRPSEDDWKEMKRLSLGESVSLLISGMKEGRIVSQGTVSFRTSRDPVGSPIFFREVVLPVREAMSKPLTTRWRLGNVSSSSVAQVVLEGVGICANCHAFTPDGKTIGMDVDTDGDKGAYVIAEVGQKIVFSKDKVISWSDFSRKNGLISYGLLSQFSPDGRYVVSTVNEHPVFALLPDLGNSQLFFPVRGIIAVYDRQTKRFFSLPGADNPDYVQTNPVFSPDGKWIVFALAKAVKGAVDPKIFSGGAALFRYDLFRIPFNDGKGGKAEPLIGASDNSRSNYFPRFTPDGRWIIYTQSDSFMIIQPDAELHIVPADGGKDRKLFLQGDKSMKSWHSISPNGRWLVFSSKANGPYTQLWLSHLDEEGSESVPVLLDWFVSPDRAANIPEFLNIPPDDLPVITDLIGH